MMFTSQAVSNYVRKLFLLLLKSTFEVIQMIFCYDKYWFSIFRVVILTVNNDDIRLELIVTSCPTHSFLGTQCFFYP